MKIVTTRAVINEILAARHACLGTSLAGYRSHTFRMMNFSRVMADLGPAYDDRLAITSAFHDLYFFPDGKRNRWNRVPFAAPQRAR
jgi:hypothetical protein